MTDVKIGIESLNAYLGMAQISVRELFQARGLDDNRYANLMMTQRSVQMPWEDPVTNAVNAARPLVGALSEDSRNRIGLIVTSTESGLDYSKSVASYVHAYLELSKHCRILEVKQACYGATGALQLAGGYLAMNPHEKALIIATDVNPMDERASYAEATTGHGAVAMIVGNDPAILALTPGSSGVYSYEIMDTARPTPELDVYNTDLSLLSYLDCLAESFKCYAGRVDGASFTDSFDYLVMHTPFGGMVKAAHRKMMRESGAGSPAVVNADFERRIKPSLTYAQRAGNICSGSVYLALASLLDNGPDAVDGATIGLFSYGSGCASEFFSGVIGAEASEAMAGIRIGGRLERRRELTFAEYERLIPAARACIVPRRDHTVDLAGCDELLDRFRDSGPTLVLARVADYHRKYEWR